MLRLTDEIQGVKFSVGPEGYRIEANGVAKTYPLIRGLDRKFEKDVASELGVDPKRLISAIDKAGGLRPELADEWSYGSEEYLDTAKARSSIQSNLRLPQRDMDTRTKYERCSFVAYQHLHSNGNFYFDPVRRECFWFDAESKILFKTRSEDFNAHLSTRLQLSREDIVFKHVLGWILDRSIKYAQRVEPRQLSYYDPTEKVLYINTAPGQVLALDGESITEEDNGQHVLFLWDQDWEPIIPRFDNNGQCSMSKDVFSKLVLDEQESSLTSEEAEALNERWLLALFFRNALPDRPIIALVGEPGSCKTTSTVLFGLVLFGKRFSVLGFEDQKEDGALAYITTTPFGVFDNADQAVRWLPDLLARTATGMTIPRRKLYTTNDLAKYVVDCMLAITARQTPWARLDVIQRLLLFRVKAPAKYIDREILQRRVLDNRHYLLGELLQKANFAVKKLRETSTAVDAPYRLAAFYRFALQTAPEDKRDLLKEAFDKIASSQGQLELEQEENLLTILSKWLESEEVHIDESDAEADPQKRKLWTCLLTVSELYGRLSKVAKDEGFRFTVNKPLSLGHRLRELRPTLRTTDIPFRKGRDRKGVWWQFGRYAQPQVAPKENDAKKPTQPTHPTQKGQNKLESPVQSGVGLVQELSHPTPNPTHQNEKDSVGVKDVKDYSAKVSPAQILDEPQQAVRLDISLIKDFVVKTAAPTEENRVGYSTREKLIHYVERRFGDEAAQIVPRLLTSLSEDGLLVEAPFRNCWQLTKAGPRPRSK